MGLLDELKKYFSLKGDTLTKAEIIQVVGEATGVVPEAATGFDLGAPATAKTIFGGAGDYTLDGVTNNYPEDLNIFFWDKTTWSALPILINLTDYVNKSKLRETTTGTNLYNLSGFIGNDGIFYSTNPEFRATPFIGIDRTTDIIIEKGLTTVSSVILALYDENKVFIPGSAVANVTGIALAAKDIPVSAKYMRSSTKLETVDTITLVAASIAGLAMQAANNRENIIIDKENITINKNKIISVNNNGAYSLPGYIGIGGLFVPLETYLSTDFIGINKASDIEVDGVYAGPSSLILGLYDKDKKLIPGSGIASATKVTIAANDIPELAKYMRSSTRIAEMNNPRIFNNSLVSTQIQMSKIDDTVVTLQKEVNAKLNRRMPLIYDGYYFSSGVLSPTANAKNTGLYPIEGFKKLNFRVVLDGAGAVVFWNEDKQALPALTIPGTATTEGTIDLTELKYADVRYVTLSYYDATGVFVKYVGDLYNDSSLEEKVNKIDKTANLFPSGDSNLKILIFGDSIVTCATIAINASNETTSYKLNPLSNSYVKDGVTISYSMWPYLITQYLDCFDLRNYAFSGASYKDAVRAPGNERQNLSYQIEVAFNDINNLNSAFPTVGEFVPDIIIYSLGTNDGTPNDTFESAMAKTVMKAGGNAFDVDATLANLDRSKFCEAVRYAFLKVKNRFPHSQYFCVLPIQRAGNDVKISGANDALKQMANRYSIKIVDGASDLGIVRDLETVGGIGANLKDGLHPTDKGQNMYARLMINEIKSNWVNTKLMNP